MGILRNSINILGIASEEELPKQINGQIVEFSESDYIYLSEIWPDINSIYKVEVKLDVKEGRVVNAPTGRIIILDGVRKIKISYRSSAYYQNYCSASFEMPFNTFVDLPNNAGEIKAINAYIIDAFFKLINSRKIYNHMVYMIEVNYPTIYVKSRGETNISISSFVTENYEEEDEDFIDE